MSNSPRALNRFLLTVVGSLVTLTGVLLALAGLFPTFADRWKRTLTDWWHATGTADAETSFSVGLWHTSWMWLVFFALLVTTVALLLSWVFAQGGGRRNVVMRRQGEEGQVIVRPQVVEQALKAELEGDPRLLKTSVSAWDARGNCALKVSVQGRKGASPREIADRVERAVRGLDRLLGKEIPLVISIDAGARTSWSAQHRVT